MSHSTILFKQYSWLRLILYLILFLPVWAAAQDSHNDLDEVKDSIVSKYNRRNYAGIYQVFDTAFQRRFSEIRVVNFLKGNQNSGKIMKSSFQSKQDGKTSYLLQCELRDMILDLAINSDKTISSFGLKNAPPLILPQAPSVFTNNPRISLLDQAVDSVALHYFRNANANSLAIGIIKNGKKYFYFYGETEKGNGQLPTSKTLYEIGSITKTFTATLLAQAVLDKKISLADDVGKYLGKGYENLSYNGVPITLQHLANHTSGLPSLPPDYGDRPDYDPVHPDAGYDSAMFYSALKKISIDTVPGYKFIYSNWGMSVLGHILEKLYGQSQASLVKRFVTGPLKMKHTGYYSKVDGLDAAIPHSENGRRLNAIDQGYFSPAGGLSSTLSDMLRYLDAQLKETKASVKLTHVTTKNYTGLGWGVRTITDVTEFQHNGMTQGTSAHISAFKEINSGCVILANNRESLSPVIINIQRLLKDPSYK